MFDDFKADSEFFRAAEKLHIEAGRQCEQCITSDGLAIMRVRIDFGLSLHVDFRLDSLTGRRGYSSAPGRFSVALNVDCDGSNFASFGCGLREPDGDFWYPAFTKLRDQSVSDDYNRWAFYRTKNYGDATLSSWIANRANKSG